MRGVLTCLAACTAEVRVSYLHDERGAGKVITLLTYPRLWMDGCDSAGILKLLGVALCNLWDHCVSETVFIVFKPRTQTEQC